MLLLQRIMLLIILLFVGGPFLTAQQDTTRVLFLGNSYTAYNNLPTLVQRMATSPNHAVVIDQYTPGGYTYQDHVNDSITMAKVLSKPWDAIVFQEQSQIPTIPFYRDQWMYPSASALGAMGRNRNHCTKLVFYQTWGRQNGGQQCDLGGNNCSPIFTDFGHMQDSLTAAYQYVAAYNRGRVAPVGEAWRIILNQGGLVLHQADESHPNLQGSYLAACVLYNTIWEVHSLNNAYTAGLSPAIAQRLQRAADTTVYGSSMQWNYEPDAVYADFTVSYYIAPNTSYHVFEVDSTPIHNSAFTWYFSDGGISTGPYTSHRFTGPPPHTVTLVVSYCGLTDTVTQNVTPLSTRALANETIMLYPNPTTNEFYVSGAQVGDQLRLYNALGQCVFQQMLQDEKAQWSVQALPDGYYQAVLYRSTQPARSLGLFKKLGQP